MIDGKMTMSAGEAANLIGISHKTMLRWLNSRLLKCRKHGGRWQLTVRDVQAARKLAAVRIECWLFAGNAGQARRLYRAGILRNTRKH